MFRSGNINESSTGLQIKIESVHLRFSVVKQISTRHEGMK
jgi:hypothetical protein